MHIDIFIKYKYYFNDKTVVGYRNLAEIDSSSTICRIAFLFFLFALATGSSITSGEKQTTTVVRRTNCFASIHCETGSCYRNIYIHTYLLLLNCKGALRSNGGVNSEMS